MNARRAALTGVALLSFTAGSAHSGPPSATSIAARIDQLQRAASAAEAELQFRRMTELRVRALELDPENFESHMALRWTLYLSTLMPDLATRVLAATATLPDEHAAACLRAFWIDSSHDLQFAPVPGDSPMARACRDFLRGIHAPAAAVEVMPRYPRSVLAQYNLLLGLGAARNWEKYKILATELSGPATPAPTRAMAAGMLALGLHALGEHEQARTLEAEWMQRLRRAPPGIRLHFLFAMSAHWTTAVTATEDISTVTRHFREVRTEVPREIAALAESADLDGRVRILSAVAQDYLDDGELHDAIRLWDRAAAAADTLGVPLFRSIAHARRGRTLVKLGRHDDAESALLHARSLARSAGERRWIMETSHDLLHLYEAQRRIPQAKLAGADFVTYATGTSGPLEMMSHRDVAWLHRRAGEPEPARRHFAAMVAKIDEIDDEHFYAGEYFESIGALDEARRRFHLGIENLQSHYRALAGLARVWEMLGETDSALAYARRHDASLSVRFPEHAPMLPGLLARSGQHVAAMRAIQQARASSGTRGPAYHAQLTLDLAELNQATRHYSRAALLADSAAAAAASVSALEIELRARGIAALARIRAGDASALAAAAALPEQASRLGTPQIRAMTQTLLGDARGAAGDEQGALAAYERAAALIDQVVASLANDAERAGLRASQITISNRGLASLLSFPRGRTQMELLVEWSLARKARELRLPRRSVSVRKLQMAIPTNAAVIDYLVLDSAVAALVLTRDSASVHILPTSPQRLRTAVGKLRVQLDARIGTAVDTTRAFFDLTLANQLYGDLLGPLTSAIAGRGRLIIAADGVLHELPFDAMVTELPRAPGDYVGAEYVLDRATVLHVPSLAALVYSPDAATAAATLAVAADPGRSTQRPGGAAREMAAIRRAIGSAPYHAVSTERRLRTLASSARFIHFATHAVPNDVDPAHARLGLVPEGPDDGLLHAYEIAQMRLSAELVVLSACETAAGRMRGGEGALSLSRAFLRAGARSTIATLWPVGEPTAAMMETFYRRLAADGGAADALRDAKRAMRHGRYAHPFFWAPFTLLTVTPSRS